MPIQYPMVNGHRYSFASVIAKFAGQQYLGFKSINYSDSLEPGEARGTASVALGATRGDYKAQGDCELLREEYQDLIDTQGNGFGEAFITITVCYDESESGNGTVMTDTIKARIKGANSSNTQGTDPSSIKCDLFIIEPISWNGKTLVRPLNTAAFANLG